jgi:phosphatidylserine/phosphatidylglycerophosphate/cardiolipin synthase-like enzyme
MIVDDRLARISSANLNNRSEGFDSECELAVEARGEADGAAIAGLRRRLAGHWVGAEAGAVAAAERSGGSFAESVRALGAVGRLRDIEPEHLGPLGEFVAAFHIGDPVDAADAWRPARRRERLYDRVRALRQAAIAAGEIPAPPPEEDDPTLPAPPR